MYFPYIFFEREEEGNGENPFLPASARYGKGNERRLTGAHETAPIDKFSYGVANRGCSVPPALPGESSLDGSENESMNGNQFLYHLGAKVVLFLKHIILNDMTIPL